MVHALYPRLGLNLFFLFVLCAAGLSPVVAAEDTAAQEFQSRAQSLGESITKDNSGISERCQRLSQDIADLKGRPQRRFTARQRYDRECTRSVSSPDWEFGGEQPGFPSGFDN